jgi:hypothetical protein
MILSNEYLFFMTLRPVGFQILKSFIFQIISSIFYLLREITSKCWNHYWNTPRDFLLCKLLILSCVWSSMDAENICQTVLCPNFRQCMGGLGTGSTGPPSLCSLAARYDNPIPARFLAPIDCSKIPGLRLWSCNRPLSDSSVMSNSKFYNLLVSKRASKFLPHT